MKQTFEIPEGCKEVTIEQIDNQIITTFELPKSEFKKGDVLAKDNCIIIFKGVSSGYERHFISLFTKTGRLTEIGDKYGWGEIEHFRYATPEEKEMLLTAMHEAGKDFDFEKMEIVDYKWKPEMKEIYWLPNLAETDLVGYDEWGNAKFEQRLLALGLICKTKEQALGLAKKMLNAIKK